MLECSDRPTARAIAPCRSSFAVVLGALCCRSGVRRAVQVDRRQRPRRLFGPAAPGQRQGRTRSPGRRHRPIRMRCKELADEGSSSSRSSRPDAAENAKKAAQQRADADRRADRVQGRARRNHAASRRIRSCSTRYNEKGEQVFMDDAERRKRRETLETMLRQGQLPAGLNDTSMTTRRPRVAVSQCNGDPRVAVVKPRRLLVYFFSRLAWLILTSALALRRREVGASAARVRSARTAAPTRHRRLALSVVARRDDRQHPVDREVAALVGARRRRPAACPG